ncbi:hypothetical protein [Sinorhizobium medicae]|uniref:hypothetical protein n=1 Tax=Sinorhizobium medicae TaxID=110321 RepID=UPI003969C47D
MWRWTDTATGSAWIGRTGSPSISPGLMAWSGYFRYDREIWGPTPAQQRRDTRTDLGNTPENDGDGFRYRGCTGMQLTGKDNYRQFRNWCRAAGLSCPDFVKDPDAVNTDPWEAWCLIAPGTPGI